MKYKLFLIASMVMALMAPKVASAYDFSAVAPSGQTLYYNIIDGGAVLTAPSGYPYWSGFPQPTGNLIIPDSVEHNGTTYAVTAIADAAFYNCDSLTAVSIGHSVTSIGASSFASCNNLVSLNFGGAEKNIGDNAFQDCGNLLGGIIIPNSVTQMGRYAFYGCNNITSIILSDSITTIEYSAFYQCSSLSSVNIPGSVVAIEGNAFYGCGNIDSIYIPNSVVSIGASAFSFCTSLKTLQIPNSVISLGIYSFSRCDRLSLVSLGESLDTIGSHAFYGCGDIISLTIPNSVVSIGNEAFGEVQHIEYHGTATGAPWGAYFMNGVTEGDFIFTNENKDTIAVYLGNGGDVVIPSTVKMIGYGSFLNRIGLTSVTIPNSVKKIGSNAFCRCDSLNSVVIGDSVSSIDNWAFMNCRNLSQITSTAKVAPLLGNNVFSGVSPSIEIDIPCGSQMSYYSRWNYFSNFIEDEGYLFSATSADSLMGTVTVLIPPTCQAPTAAINASANDGFHFSGWSDGSTDNPRTLTVTQDTIIIAYFASNAEIDEVDGYGVAIKLENGRIIVDGTSDKFDVYDIMGRKMENNSLRPGIYLVKPAGLSTRKVVVCG